MSLLSNLFQRRPEPLLCPHCENPMVEGHDVDACARKRMSRRFFFGVLGGAAAALVVAPAVVEESGLSMRFIRAFDPVQDVWHTRLVTPEMFARMTLHHLQAMGVLGRNISGELAAEIAEREMRIGDDVIVRRPYRHK